MAKKQEQETAADMLRQFDSLKQKHPDAMLLFRKGDFYEMYREDAVKAAAVLAITLTSRVLPGEKAPVKYTLFPYHALDVYLPKLIRSGQRVAICDPIETPRQKKEEKAGLKAGEKSKVKEEIIPNNTDMAKKKKDQAVQDKPVQIDPNEVKEKPARQKSTEQKAGTEQKAEAKADANVEQQAEAKKERKPREPQMVTADGGKVTHGHAYQGKDNPEDWYFTAKIDGQQLKPQKMDAADLAAYQKKELTVPQLMERYYPTKLMPKVPEDTYRFPRQMEGAEGAVAIEKFNVYKEKDEQRPDFGRYKFYAQVDGARMSAVASRQDLNAYFDRVMTPNQLIEKNFGERLHLKSAYEKYRLPEGVDPKGVRVAKDHTDNKWKVYVDIGDKSKTARHEISFDDGYSLFKTRTATREQIAAKYLTPEINGLLSAQTNRLEKSNSMKI